MKTISKQQHVYSMNKENEPVCFCQSHDTVVFEVLDCYSDLVTTSDYHWDDFLIRVNPATGPLYIEDAQPKDSILVKIEKIDCNNKGLITSKPYIGFYGKDIEEITTTIVDIKDNKIHLHGHTFDIRPMIGVIGVAPLAGDMACNTPNNHGGNLDCSIIREGCSVQLPVFCEGALLSIGGLRALMGDGKLNGNGIEVGGSVKVTVKVLKNHSIHNPRVYTEDRFYTIASGIDMDMASGIASREMMNVLQKEHGYTMAEATQLISVVGALEVCQIVNPLVTMRCSVPLSILRNK